jgi:glycosyltransferase involved in cell wall biosynthesis
MALGVPPIAFDVGGLPELVEPQVSGLLVPPGDVAAFSGAAALLILDHALRRRLGEAGPARAAEFSVARMAEGTARAYRHALGVTRRAPVRWQQ